MRIHVPSILKCRQRGAIVQASRDMVMWKKMNEAGSRLAGRTADLAGAPMAIILVALFCAAWFFEAGEAGENSLTLILSVASISLTQMVLNGQRRSEQALHLKIDELVYAMKGARNEVAGIESKTTEELEALRRTGDAAEVVLEERAIAASDASNTFENS